MPSVTDAAVIADPRPAARPWWHSLVKVLTACGAAFVLGAGVASVANRTTVPGRASVDVRFLQDMRWHHDQAVRMALAQVRKTGGDATVRQIAQEIVLDQQLASGSMVEQLHNFGAAEANETDTAMEWMKAMAPTTPDTMPGMATPDQLTELAQADGKDADILFLRLMSAHHAGGIHMSDYAAEHATTARVRELAKAMSTAQQQENAEMLQLQSKIGGA